MPTHLSPPGTVPTSPTTPLHVLPHHSRQSSQASDRKFEVALIGTGGVGTIAALVLEKSGRAKVTAVVRSNYKVVKENGWDIESVDHGNLKGWRCWRVVPSIQDALFPAPTPSLPTPTGAPTPLEPSRITYDYIVLCTKQLPSHQDLSSMIAPLVTPHITSIVLIQNGLFIYPPFINAFPNNVTMSAVTMVGSSTVPPNRVLQIGPDTLQIGPHYHDGVDDRVSLERTKTFVEMYSRGGTKMVEFVDDMPRARWAKLLLNGTYNPICALIDVTVGAVQSSGAREGLVLPIMRELQAVAKADGVVLDEDVVQFMAFRTPDGSTYRPSMLLDRENGRPMEFEVILGDPVKRGKELGVPTPVTSTIYELLKLAKWKEDH